MQIETVTALFPGLEQTELLAWVERGWVRPDGAGGAFVFTEIDIARVRLVRDLRRELEVPEDMLALVLSLMDQLYASRDALRAVRRAVETQPPPVRSALLDALRNAS
jgi:chaperone modulatory protein CbpM